MELIELVNSCIKYVYILLGIIIIILFIVLSKNIKPIKKGFGVTKLYIDSFNSKFKRIKEDKEKLEYTSKNTLPLVGFMTISIGVLISSIKENHKNKKGLVKNVVTKYKKVNKVLDPKRSGKYVKQAISKVSKIV